MTEKDSDSLCDPRKSLNFFESQFPELMCKTSGHIVVPQHTNATVFSDQVTSETEKKLCQDNDLAINEAIYSFSYSVFR